MAVGKEEIRGITGIIDTAAPGVFVDTMTREGGLVVAKLCKDLRDRFDRMLNVKDDFGAVGLGGNDTAALTEAFAYCAPLKIPLYFPLGTYGVADNVAHLLGASSNQTLHIIGAGRTRSVIKALVEFDDPMIWVEGAAATRQSNFVCEHMGFDANNLDVVLHQHKYTSYARYSHCAFSRFVNSGFVAESMWDAQFRDCDFYSGGTAGVPAVWMKEQLSSSQKNNNCVFEQCRWENLLGIGIQFDLECRKNALLRPKFDVVDHCVKCTSDILLEIRGGHVTHCVTGFTGTGVSGHLIDGVAFDGNTGTLISFTSTSNYCQVEGCVGGVPEANSSSVVTLSGTGNVFEATRNRGLTAP